MSAVSTQHSLMRDHYLSSKLVIGIPFCNMTDGILPLHFKPIFIRHSLSAIPIPHSPPLLAISGFSAQNFQAPSPPLPVSIKPPNRQKCVKYRMCSCWPLAPWTQWNGCQIKVHISCSKFWWKVEWQLWHPVFPQHYSQPSTEREDS